MKNKMERSEKMRNKIKKIRKKIEEILKDI